MLADEDAYHLQAFFARAQVLDFGLFENRAFVHNFIQLTIVDVIGLHVLPPSLGCTRQNSKPLELPQAEASRFKCSKETGPCGRYLS